MPLTSEKLEVTLNRLAVDNVGESAATAANPGELSATATEVELLRTAGIAGEIEVTKPGAAGEEIAAGRQAAEENLNQLQGFASFRRGQEPEPGGHGARRCRHVRRCLPFGIRAFDGRFPADVAQLRVVAIRLRVAGTLARLLLGSVGFVING